MHSFGIDKEHCLQMRFMVEVSLRAKKTLYYNADGPQLRLL